MSRPALLLLSFTLLLAPVVAMASLRPSALFSDGMVLQRDFPVAVWGAATPGESVTVQFAGQSVSTPADASGRWLVRLAPLAASSTPRPLRIQGSTTVELNDVLVGEVWIASGQSNIARRLGPASGQKPILGADAAIASASHPLLRVFTVASKIAPDAPAPDPSGRWVASTPASAIDFSAVGYFFARDLHAHLGVPVGLIVSAHGGSPIAAWMSPSSLASLPEGRAALASPRSVPYERPAVLFHGMIAPLIPFTARGVLWYQGESDRRSPATYAPLLANLISDWRARWGQPSLPFLLVQLPPHREIPPEIREAQRQVHRTTPGTALITLTDAGDADDLHPANKEPVGRRLALAARAVAHGEPVLWSGPSPSRARPENGGLVLTFDFTAGGLDTSDSSPPRGWELAGPDGVFQPASATLLGDRLFLRSPAVPHPVSVRHGWARVPDTNLVNTHGLPAVPFSQSFLP